MSLILKQEPANTIATPPAGKSTLFVTDQSVMAVKSPDGNVTQFPTVQGSNTQVFFNDEGSINASANLTFNKNTNALTLTNGNVVATGVKTDNLYYANGNPWDLQQPAGSNGQIQFNNNDSFGASANLTFDGTSLNTTANLNVTGNAYISGNLTVDGNVVYVNVESLSVEDPLISLGGGANGAPLTSNNGYDRGLILHNYTSQAVDAFMGWDTSNGEFAFASNASVASDVVTINQLGNVRANLIAGTLSTAAQPNITSVGLLTGLLVGATASQADFPNAKVILSQDNSGQTHSENIGVVGEAVADSGNTSTWGIGVLGEARANGATKATGVQGGGYVTNSTDSGAAVGVRGYSIQTHSGGYNIGVLGNAAGSGLGNYAFYVQAGDVGSIETETNWDLYDNSQVALTFRSSGKANIFGVDTTDGAEGVYTEGYLNVSGNAAVGGLLTNNLYYANGSPWDLQEAAGSNTYVQYNSNGDFGASSTFTFNDATNTLSATNITGTLTTNANAQPNITSVGTLTGLAVSGNANIDANLYVENAFSSNGTIYASGNIESGANIGATGNIDGANFNAVGNVVANIVTANSSSISGNLSAGNISASGKITATGNIDGGNVSSLGIVTAVGNVNAGNVSTGGKVTASGNINTLSNVIAESKVYIGNNATNITLLNPVLIGSASGETYVQAALVNQNANGSSDWSAYSDNGNTDAGWADMGFTGSTFNDANYTITKPNDGYFFVQSVNGAGLGGNLVLATGDQGANNDIVFATGGFLANNEKMRFINASNQFYIEPTTVSTSTTTGALRVAGGVGIAGNVYVGGNISGNIVAPGSNTQILFNDGGVANADSGLTYNKSTDALTAIGTVTAGNLSTAGTLSVTGNSNVGNLGTGGLIVATGNVTGGNLTTAGVLSVTGNANVGNLGTAQVLATANVTAPQLISNVATGTAPLTVTSTTRVANLNVATSGVANTVNDAAQPNITSVGTLTSVTVTGTATAGNLSTGGTLSVTGNANVGNLGTAGLIVASGNVTGGNLTTSGLVNATGNIVTSANLVTDLIVGKTTGVSITATGTNQNINLTPTGTGTVNVGNFIISNVATPVSDFDAATKKYVDDVAQGLHTHDACNAATQTTLATISGGTVTYNNGTSGVGATLTTTGSYTTIDGVTLSNGMRILVKNEANAAHNGIYDRTSSTVLTRSSDFDTSTEMAGGDFTFVSAGTLYDNTGWVMTDPVTTVGTTAVNWVQFSGAGTYTAGTGLTLSGSQFSITDTSVTAGAYGNGDYNATFTVNSQGQLTAAANVALTPNAANLSGTTLKSTVVNSSLTSVGTLTSLNVSGNANVGNIGGTNGVFTTVAGTLSTAAQPNITSTGTLTSLTVSGNASAGNLNTAGAVVASTLTSNVATGTAPLTVTSTTRVNNLNVAYANVADNINVSAGTGNNFIIFANAATGNVAELTSTGLTANLSNNSITATTFVGALSGAATTAGTVTTAAQPNITSTGTLTSLTVTGNVAAGNLTTAGQLVSSVATGTAPLVVTSTTTVANLNVAAATVAGTVTAAAQGNITSVGTLSSLTVSGNVSAGNVSGTLLTGTLTTAAQPNITSVGTLSSLSVTGNISAANVTATHYGAATGLTGIPGANVTGTVANATFATSAGSATSATSATTAGTVTTAAQPNITSVGTLTSLTVSGALTTTNITTGANSTAGTITGNFSLSAGSRLNATYADLAEKYVADATYEPGTVLVFGGDHEVTMSTESDSFRVAGVVTTDPAYTMNNDCQGEHVATMALQGRVPVKVLGPIFKGDLLVSASNGYATANNIARAGTIIGKSLENFTGASGIIEVAVGRF